MTITRGKEYLSEAPARMAPDPRPAGKLHSIFGLQRHHAIIGSFETAVTKYEFEYHPAKAVLVDNRLQLTGTLTLASARGVKKAISNVTATLMSSQSGVAGVPGAIISRAPKPQPGSLPGTEAAGPFGFVGALFFRLSPISSRQSGTRIDMSQVQLNCRLAPTSETERKIQVLLTDIVASLLSESPDVKAATPHIDQLNNLIGEK